MRYLSDENGRKFNEVIGDLVASVGVFWRSDEALDGSSGPGC